MTEETKQAFPQTLQEAIIYFANPDNALAFMVELRWPNGITCPRCGSDKHTFVSTRRTWQCLSKECKKMFTVKLGTLMEDSPIGLDKWLTAMWLIVNAKNGISSYEIARAIGVTQKSAWFLLHRIRLAMQCNSFEKLSGQIEADETFIGGKARNMHLRDKRAKGMKGTGHIGKIVVLGLLERHGEVRTQVVTDRKHPAIHKHIRENVEEGSQLFTDQLPSYLGLEDDFAHKIINHAEAYVKENVHTNGIENFWSLLKRSIHGTYVSVEPFHLFRYLDEQSFRFNNRKINDQLRFLALSRLIVGRRLTYGQLTGK